MLPRRVVFGLLCLFLASATISHWAVPHPGTIIFQAQTPSPAYVIASLDGTVLASVSLRDQAIVLWDMIKRTRIATLHGFRGFGRPIAFSPDSRLLATGGTAGIVHLWDVATGRERAALRGHVDAVASLAFSPDGKMIASASYDKTIRLWDAIHCKAIATLRGHAARVYCVAFAPDSGMTLASGDASTIKLWDVTTRRETVTLTEGRHSITSVVFSPDGKMLASSEFIEGGRLWDVRSRKEIPLDSPPWLDEYDDSVQHFAFSADSSLLAVATDMTAGVWNVANGKITSLFGRGHRGGLSGALTLFKRATPNSTRYYISSLHWKSDNELITLGRGEESVIAGNVAIPR